MKKYLAEKDIKILKSVAIFLGIKYCPLLAPIFDTCFLGCAICKSKTIKHYNYWVEDMHLYSEGKCLTCGAITIKHGLGKLSDELIDH